MYNYDIHVDAYTGPYERLLDLISSQEIDLYNIPIHKITRDFISDMDSLEMPIQLIADFVAFASLLLEIKSKMLLPDHELIELSLDDSEDPRIQLLNKLIAYEQVRNQSKLLIEILVNQKPREYIEDHSLKLIASKKEEISGLDVQLLSKSMNKVLKKQERFNEDRRFFEKLSREKYSVERKKVEIMKLLDQVNHLDFWNFTKQMDKTEKISVFLGMLKLQQEQSAHVSQPGVFDPIRIERIKHDQKKA